MKELITVTTKDIEGADHQSRLSKAVALASKCYLNRVHKNIFVLSALLVSVALSFFFAPEALTLSKAFACTQALFVAALYVPSIRRQAIEAKACSLYEEMLLADKQQ